MKQYFVYILTNKSKKSLYIWVTNNLERRIFEHKTWIIEWFTKKYNCNILVYFEEFNNIKQAIEVEKKLKNWKREWKENLIKEKNSNWKDLSIWDPETSSGWQ